MLGVLKQIVIMLSGVMPTIIMLSVIMPTIIMLITVMLSVVLMSAVMPSVMAPSKTIERMGQMQLEMLDRFCWVSKNRQDCLDCVPLPLVNATKLSFSVIIDDWAK